MSERIDEKRVRAVIFNAIGPWSCLAEASQNGVFVVPRRDRAIELAMPLAGRAAEHLVRLPWASRVRREDVEEAAIEGLIEAVDSYEPRRCYRGTPILPSTHFFWRIRKRVYEEIQDTHWLIAKPSRADIESYMKGQMSESERIAYVNAVLRPIDNPEERYMLASGRAGEALSNLVAQDLSS